MHKTVSGYAPSNLKLKFEFNQGIIMHKIESGQATSNLKINFHSN